MSSASPAGADGARELAIGGRAFGVHQSLLWTPYPQVLSIEATNFCNLSCTHCKRSVMSEFSKGNFDLRLLGKIDHLIGTSIPSVALSDYGEPFLSGAWRELLAWAVSHPAVPVSFTTNGLLLDRHMEEILERQISVSVSIDGATEETYGHFRGKGLLQKLIDNLMKLKEYKTARGVDYPGVSVFFAVSGVNCHELVRMVELTKEIDAGTLVVQFQLFFDRGRFERESVYFRQEEYDRHIAAARQRAGELGVCLLHPDSFDGRSVLPREGMPNLWLGRTGDGAVRCFAQQAACYVKYNGIVEACCAPSHLVMGDLQVDSFEDIWHGPYYRALRLAFDRGEWPGPCTWCNLIQSIDSGDERAHFIPLHDVAAEGGSVSQPYRVTEVERIYREAVACLPDYGKAFGILASIRGLDENLYEIENLAACLMGLQGDIGMMSELIGRCSRIAPRDEIIAHNEAALAVIGRGAGFSRE